MVDMPLILRMARLVEPHEFRRWQEIYVYNIRSGLTEQAARAAADHWHGAGINNARDKARAILAAISQATPAMQRAALDRWPAESPQIVWSTMVQAALEEGTIAQQGN